MDTTALLWLIGAAGSGKTATGWAVFRELAAAGVRAAFVDGDQVGMAYPAPPGDRDNEHVKARGLGALWAGYRAAGVQCVVAAGGVGTAATVADFAAQVPGAAMTVVELTVDAAERQARLIGRGSADLVEPAAALAAAFDRAPLTEHRVDTGGRTVDEVARLVLDRVGRPAAGAGPWPPRRFPAPEPIAGERVPLLWVCGATGVGKSTVAFPVFLALLAAGERAAYIDLAQVGWARPEAPGDPGGHLLRARNFGALWRSHRAAGSRVLVVSGSGGGPADMRRYLDAVPDCDPLVVRLDARPDVLAERVLMRSKGIGVELPGDELRGLAGADLDRAVAAAQAEAVRLAADGVGAVHLDTSDRSPEQLAAGIHARLVRRGGGAAAP
ncbi:hypothetical protein [Glycomyces terrestris]|uniref:Adenylyl-sulfate kinase n=1 Tax=Glycomyces terrestris TaxID=2493553 RepID=A0A426UW71_9ACTN|nr:hypothetical protein [Glycomyces terrestris]RRR98585.1 hypothetical protein EIW28_17110 [Glycomyces terrestris]